MYTFDLTRKKTTIMHTNKQENRISFVLNITLVKSIIFWWHFNNRQVLQGCMKEEKVRGFLKVIVTTKVTEGISFLWV